MNDETENDLIFIYTGDGRRVSLRALLKHLEVQGLEFEAIPKALYPKPRWWQTFGRAKRPTI